MLLTGIFLVRHPLAFIPWGLLLAGLTALSRLPFSMVLRSAKPVLILVNTSLIHIFYRRPPSP
ncbi:hypothetical protein MASR2M79_05260 [Aminivibrio sp.]